MARYTRHSSTSYNRESCKLVSHSKILEIDRIVTGFNSFTFEGILCTLFVLQSLTSHLPMELSC